jgi:CubicO group peptidase (beta-lactamase class C family)
LKIKKDFASVVFVLSLCAFAFVSCETEESLARKRIKAVETGLLKAVVFKGEDPERMKLSERMQFYRVPGLSIAVIDKHAIEWAKGYGVVRVDSANPVSPDSLFQATSVSQSLVALAAMHLSEQRKIRLDSDVNSQLKSWRIPESSVMREQKVTPRLLLSHSAGLASLKLAGLPPEKKLPTLLDILQGSKPSDSPGVYVYETPGTKVQYSELGFAVLQQLFEDLAGKPFHQIMADTVLSSLAMRNSTYEIPLPDKLRSLAVVGHSRQGDPVEGGWFHYPASAASGLWSTPSDLALFAIDIMKTALGQSHTIAYPESVRTMLTSQLENKGLGFEIEDKGEDLYFAQRGENEGFQCYLIAYPSRGQGAVVMVNSDNGAYLIEELLRSISDAYKWPHFIPEIKTYYRLDPSIYAQYVGEYEVNPDYVLAVTHEDYYLVIQPTGQAPTKFYVESQTKFFSVDPYIEIRFLKGDDGKIDSLLLTQREHTSTAKKIR